MNKKFLVTAAYILMFLPLIVTVISMFYLPERIPAHYGFSGKVDRWGSKYESLIFPVTIIAFGFFMLLTAKISAKRDQKTPERERKGQDNEKQGWLTNVAVLSLFNIMNFYFLYTAYAQIENLSETSFDLSSAIFAFIGVLFVIMGIIMPKVPRNAIFGLRTKWSMKNDVSWAKSQRFGGISFITAGFLLIAGAALLRESTCVYYGLFICTVMLIADVVYSYRISK